jgi:hypothetical protein
MLEHYNIKGRPRFKLELSDVLGASDMGDDFIIEDWPRGGWQFCSMRFRIESSKRGERLVKQSTYEGKTYPTRSRAYTGRVKIIGIGGHIGVVECSYSMAYVTVVMQNAKYVNTTFREDEASKIVRQLFFVGDAKDKRIAELEETLVKVNKLVMDTLGS